MGLPTRQGGVDRLICPARAGTTTTTDGGSPSPNTSVERRVGDRRELSGTGRSGPVAGGGCRNGNAPGSRSGSASSRRGMGARPRPLDGSSELARRRLLVGGSAGVGRTWPLVAGHPSRCVNPVPCGGLPGAPRKPINYISRYRNPIGGPPSRAMGCARPSGFGRGWGLDRRRATARQREARPVGPRSVKRDSREERLRSGVGRPSSVLVASATRTNPDGRAPVRRPDG